MSSRSLLPYQVSVVILVGPCVCARLSEDAAKGTAARNRMFVGVCSWVCFFFWRRGERPLICIAQCMCLVCSSTCTQACMCVCVAWTLIQPLFRHIYIHNCECIMTYICVELWIYTFNPCSNECILSACVFMYAGVRLCVVYRCVYMYVICVWRRL